MKNYDWWLKQKQRVRKKYALLCSKYLSPKETKEFARKLIKKRQHWKNMNE